MSQAAFKRVTRIGHSVLPMSQVCTALGRVACCVRSCPGSQCMSMCAGFVCIKCVLVLSASGVCWFLLHQAGPDCIALLASGTSCDAVDVTLVSVFVTFAGHQCV